MASRCKGMPRSMCVSGTFIVHDVQKTRKRAVNLSLDWYDTGQGLSAQLALLPKMSYSVWWPHLFPEEHQRDDPRGMFFLTISQAMLKT